MSRQEFTALIKQNKHCECVRVCVYVYTLVICQKLDPRGRNISIGTPSTRTHLKYPEHMPTGLAGSDWSMQLSVTPW